MEKCLNGVFEFNVKHFYCVKIKLRMTCKEISIGEKIKKLNNFEKKSCELKKDSRRSVFCGTIWKIKHAVKK